MALAAACSTGMALAPPRLSEEEEGLERDFCLLKYVIAEVLPTSLIGSKHVCHQSLKGLALLGIVEALRSFSQKPLLWLLPSALKAVVSNRCTKMPLLKHQSLFFHCQGQTQTSFLLITYAEGKKKKPPEEFAPLAAKSLEGLHVF